MMVLSVGFILLHGTLFLYVLTIILVSFLIYAKTQYYKSISIRVKEGESKEHYIRKLEGWINKE